MKYRKETLSLPVRAAHAIKSKIINKRTPRLGGVLLTVQGYRLLEVYPHRTHLKCPVDRVVVQQPAPVGGEAAVHAVAAEGAVVRVDARQLLEVDARLVDVERRGVDEEVAVGPFPAHETAARRHVQVGVVVVQRVR